MPGDADDGTASAGADSSTKITDNKPTDTPYTSALKRALESPAPNVPKLSFPMRARGVTTSASTSTAAAPFGQGPRLPNPTRPAPSAPKSNKSYESTPGASKSNDTNHEINHPRMESKAKEVPRNGGPNRMQFFR
ncbi:hypothetical protein CkaCkLH20_12231 [Colletotrichum karsti]|uniref:Uncharacterized protein n=1 Tax=Colletotrichum karsti TaxID=1095194 RepID=A0A9P6HSX6_9PEZI|nr:uncharacterized protein CkaCkLH20_12231 [Colletotrichum karsti]KAF9870267.1 hypothetical protein CkaCkLH20_12231 [Colletotrichum karsti]